MNDPAKILAAKYRMIFGTTEGQDVLMDIVERGMLLNPCETQMDIGRENLAKEILALALSRPEDDCSMVRKLYFKIMGKKRR